MDVHAAVEYVRNVLHEFYSEEGGEWFLLDCSPRRENDTGRAAWFLRPPAPGTDIIYVAWTGLAVHAGHSPKSFVYEGLWAVWQDVYGYHAGTACTEQYKVDGGVEWLEWY